MKKLAGNLCCLILMVVNASAGEFTLLEPHSASRTERLETFVVADEFKVGRRIGGRTLSAVGWNFADHFLAVVERNVPEEPLSAWTLLYTAGDKSLVEALGGEEVGVIRFIAHVHHLMELGENGPSHVDWRSNFAYMRSPVDRKLWAVHWNVNSAGDWNVGAVPVPHPQLDWRSGSRVFSRLVVPPQPKLGTASRDHVWNR